MLRIATSRFGELELAEEELWQFPAGLVGLEGFRRWVLLGDQALTELAWLQALEQPELALAVVSPGNYVAQYRPRVAASDLGPLRLSGLEEALVLVIVGRQGPRVTLNLKAPLILNPSLKVGRQVVAGGDEPLRFVLGETSERRRAA